MSNSTIKFYKSAVMLPERNAIFDEMNEEVLGEVVYQLLDFQYQRIELLKTIKISIQQNKAYYNDYNVVSIKNSDDPRTYYYFITGSKQTAQNTVQFDLLLDVLNSYKIGTDFAFTDRTKLIREHKDRFFDSTTPISRTSTDLRTMKVDKEPEGLGDANKQKYTELVMNDDTTALNQKWYLAYISDSTNEKAPMRVQLVPQNEESIKIGNSGGYRFTANNVSEGEFIYFYNIGKYNKDARVVVGNYASQITNLNGTINNDSYYGFALYKTGSSLKAKKVKKQDGILVFDGETTFLPTGTVDITAVNTTSRFWKLAGSPSDIQTDSDYINRYGVVTRIYQSSDPKYANSISSIDRTSPLLQKLIECPYCPIDISFGAGDIASLPTGWEVENNDIVFKGETSMLHTVLTKNLPSITVDLHNFVGDLKTQNKMIGYEPKLLHSDFTTYKLSYDSYSMEIKYENIKDTLGSSSISHRNPQYKLQYKQSDNISSSLIFKPEAVNYRYDAQEDYPIILSNRNNEATQYNNQYLNYMRTDYQYDKKLQDQQISAQWTQLGISVAGTVVGAVVGAVTANPIALTTAISSGATTLQSLSGIVQSTIQRETVLQAKQANLKAQGTSVSGANDLSLLNYYNGNKVRQYQYRISDELRQNLYDLFFKTGYASSRIGLPNINSRYRFDFCQCNADIISNTVPADVVQEIKGRFGTGVTVYHYHQNSAPNNKGYDFNQQYENWEVGLIE